MDKLYDLKEMLCDELKEYGSKDKLDVGGLEIVDKLAHAVKNIDKIIEAYEDGGYSEGSYTGRGPMGPYNRGGSYAKRDIRGRYSRGYSRSPEMVEELRGMMQDAPNEQIRREMERLVQKLEQM